MPRVVPCRRAPASRREARGEADVAQPAAAPPPGSRPRAAIASGTSAVPTRNRVVLLDGVGLPRARLREHAGALHRRLAYQHRPAPRAGKPLPVSLAMPHCISASSSRTRFAQQVVEAGLARHLRGRPRCRSGPVRRGRPARGGPSARTRKSGFWPWVLMVTESSSDMPSAAVGSGRLGHAQHQLADALRDLSPGAPSFRRLLGSSAGAWWAIGIEVSSPFCLASAMALAAALFAGPRSLHRGLQAAGASPSRLQECIDQVAGAAARPALSRKRGLAPSGFSFRVDHDLADTNASRKAGDAVVLRPRHGRIRPRRAGSDRRPRWPARSRRRARQLDVVGAVAE